VSWD
jgi:hypothetical protein